MKRGGHLLQRFLLKKIQRKLSSSGDMDNGDRETQTRLRLRLNGICDLQLLELKSWISRLMALELNNGYGIESMRKTMESTQTGPFQTLTYRIRKK